ncbi:hypothetical protein KKF61_07810 [Patescibacteria group bacterium]|nr:hypothetical protein [Patescibacteria group bacterium]
MEKSYGKTEVRIDTPDGECVYSGDSDIVDNWVREERKNENSKYRNTLLYIVELNIDEMVVEVDIP